MRIWKSAVIVALALVVGLSADVSAHTRKNKKEKVKVAPSAATFSERPLLGWRGRVRLENGLANVFGLPQIADNSELQRFISEAKLLRVEQSAGFTIDPKLDSRFHFLRPQALGCLKIALAAGFFEEFRVPFKVTSLVRTKEYHDAKVHAKRISSANCESEETCSLHVRGIAFDISRKGLSEKQLQWLRRKLVDLYKETHGAVRATEERSGRLNNFHVVVYPNFSSAQK
jgi:hypothetical protein